MTGIDFRDTETFMDNLSAFNKLLDTKEHQDDSDQSRYRYYEDLYSNQYRWTTHKQGDGKFHATLLRANRSRRKGWLLLDKIKDKAFRKRKDAKHWCQKQYVKAVNHQREVLNRRTERKQQKLDAKPKFTKEEIGIKSAQKKIAHYRELQAKADKKIKSLNTRKKTYEKRIKYHRKRITDLDKKRLVIQK